LDNRNYEKKISDATSSEEVEAVREEILLLITEKSKNQEQTPTKRTKAMKIYSNNKPLIQNNDKVLEKLVKEITKLKDNRDSIQSLENKLDQSEQQTKKLEEQLNNLRQNAVLEAQKLKKEIQHANKQENNFN
jgi:DNA repair ATPase RecN